VLAVGVGEVVAELELVLAGLLGDVEVGAEAGAVGEGEVGARVFESMRLFQYWKPAVKLLIMVLVRMELNVTLVRMRSLMVKLPSERST